MAKSSLSAVSRSPTPPARRLLVQRAELIEPQSRSSIGNLWQMPLLLVSLGLFTLAAYLLIDPQPAPSLQRQLAIAQRDIDAERFDAAIGLLNDVLATRPEPADEGASRLLLAEALDQQMRRSRRQEAPQTHRRIIEEIQRAYAVGLVATPDTSDRLARSYEALGQIDDAAANYQRAVALLEQESKAQRAVPMRRSAIDMLVAHDRQVTAAEALRQFLDVAGLSDDERAWALGELARLSIDAGRHAEAKSLLAAALALSPDESITGQVNFRLGYAAWKLGERADAENRLILARQQLGAGHPLDAEACYLLGRLAQEREAFAEADEHYTLVLRDYADSRVAPRALLARGTVRLLMGEDELGAADLAALAEDMALKPALAPLKSELLGALQRGHRILVNRQKYELALSLLKGEQAVQAQADPELLLRLGLCLEALSEQIEGRAADAGEQERPALQMEAAELKKQAAQIYLARSRQLADAGEPAYSAAFWKALDLYESASDVGGAIAALEQFCAERPDDPIAADALLGLGLGYQQIGRREQGMRVFQRLLKDHPGSPAAQQAAVPLAQAYLVEGQVQRAETLLRSVIDNGDVLPANSATMRQASWELGDLYYRSDRFAEALTCLEDFGSRFESDLAAEPARAAQLAFLKADCHRRTAAARLAEAARAADPLNPARPDAQLASAVQAGASDSATRQHLESAGALFEQAVSLYRQLEPKADVDETYQRLSHFYRADCMFDLGRYEEAIDLYKDAARRYQDDPSALAAYMQIASAYSALGKPAEAKVASERAKWLLRRVSPDEFSSGGFAVPREYWEHWLKLVGESGA